MKKTRILLYLVTFLLFPGVLPFAWADPVDVQIPYQKKTTLAYPQTYTLRFSLWDQASGGNEVWFEEKPINLNGPKIVTLLGDHYPLDDVDFSQQLWVQVEKRNKNGTYKILGARDKLQVVPYAA